MKRIWIKLLAFLSVLLMTQQHLRACTYTINKTVIQPTCGCNGLLSFSMTPPPNSGANYKIYRDGSFLVGINGSIANLNALCPGTYKVVVTDNTSACVDSLDNIVLDVPANALSATYYIDSPRCDTSTNGKLAIKISNATYPVTYQWSRNGNAFTNNDSVVKPALKGKYAVTVVDAANCRVEKADMEVLEIQGKMLALDTIMIPTSCDSPNGMITVKVDGRHKRPEWTSGFKIKWSPDRPDRDTFDFIDSLVKGKYSVVFEDSLGCYPLEIKELEVLQNPSPKAIIKGTDTLCPNVGFGRLEVFVTLGDSMNMQYRWNQGQTSKKVEGSEIVAGDYECIVTDRAGCADTARWVIHPYPERQITIVPEFREILRLTPQMLRIDYPVGLYSIVWNSIPENKFDRLLNKDSVIRSNNVTENTTYTVAVKYGPNCETDANITIKVIDKKDEIKDENIPNIFTPGSSTLTNTKYKLRDLDNNFGTVRLFNTFEFKVYDRWGNLIFNTDKETFEWDGSDSKGQPAMSGVYTYLLKYSTVSKPFDILLKKGSILLER